jgi:CYTH domain-containing protein/predicted ATPase
MQTPAFERRWLVLAYDHAVLDPGLGKPTHIVQGYLDTPPNHSLRVRLSDNSLAELTRKYGEGVERQREDESTTRKVAEFLLKSCDTVEKRRFLREGGWKLDLFGDPLSGIVLLEHPVADENEKVALPWWITKAEDVTYSLSNQHLARLAAMRRDTPDDTRSARDHLARRLPHIVLDGPAGCGKTTAMATLRQEFGERVHCVPEAATIVIGQVGAKPPMNDPVGLANWQKSLYAVQREFSSVSNAQAVRDGKEAVIEDRGTVDCAAFLPGKLREFERLCRTTVQHEYAQYALVLMLETSPRDVYERIKLNNPARKETWEQSRDQGESLKEVWRPHPNAKSIPNGRNWEDKMESIRREVRNFLESKKA